MLALRSSILPNAIDPSAESISRLCLRNAFGEDGRDGSFLPVLADDNLYLFSTLGEYEDIDVGVDNWLKGEFVYLVDGVSDRGRSWEAWMAFCISAASGLRIVRCSFALSTST